MADIDLDQLETELKSNIEGANDLAALDAVRVAALGKKGSISDLLKTLGAMDADTRKIQGPLINGLRDRVAQYIQEARLQLENAALNARLIAERVDVSLPISASAISEGRIHPISQTMDELTAIFADLGFVIADGPDIETDFYNFTALNIPETHPARQMHDTFYFEGEEPLLLRTHTSPVQIRTMEQGAPPFRFIAPGRTYRCDSDQTHTPMFHQLEGLMVDETTNLGHLKWTLEAFLAAFFEVDEIKIRFRPSYFPFTEPSMEVDMQCDRSGGTVRIGGGNDWLEIGGSGMVNRAVLEHAGIDADKYQGFAFGMGIDRLAMLKYGMPDLRAFFDADLRWLKHYGFVPFDMPDLARGLSDS
ncbi:phenylalanine--tRNA ligase subunit alpha [Alphaproteobacteria bacterium]|nr:phenylalanine--tRNA ligase subunit alpha [Alphaproteobacteria bacterium]